jgi:putative transposase
MPKGLNPCVNSLGKINLTEKVPDEAIGKTAIISKNKGRWFIQVQQHIKIKHEIQGKDIKCVGIDPGVRTFASGFSQAECFKMGEDFAKIKLNPLMKKVYKLIGRKQKILNLFNKNDTLPQWANDNLKYINKKINSLKCKKDDILLDLHNRIAFDLISKYDVIFLPSFETKSMTKRKHKNGFRKLRTSTCRSMLDLNHYSFKMRIKWYAKKYGKHVIDVNEAYTSKTRSWNGSIDNKLNSKKYISDGSISVDRDINAARNIFIKHLSR